jgi:hypothetical protein
MNTINQVKTQVYFCCSKDVLSLNSRTGAVCLKYKEAINISTDEVRNLASQIACFGYKGNDFALDSWANKLACNLIRYAPIDNTREGLWFAHQETEGKSDAEIYEIIKMHKRCGLDTDWLYLVKKARKAKSKGVYYFFVTWLSQHDKPTAQIYFNYLKWFFAQ